MVARGRRRLPPRTGRLLGGRVRLVGAKSRARPALGLPRPLLAGSGSTSCTSGQGPRRPVLPVVLCHGWPDSFWRYSKVVPLLTDPGADGADPADAFDVVVPDMPGYGYSDRPTGPPLDAISSPACGPSLWTSSGTSFGAAGGDIGSGVSRYLAADYPDRVMAVHRMDAGLPVFTGDLA